MKEQKVSDLMTFPEAAAALGAPNRRSVYRAVERAEADGEQVTVKAFGKKLVKRSAIEVLKHYYFPFGSEQRHELAVYCGQLGGAAKRDNAANNRASS
jgi:hypothetical protein